MNLFEIILIKPLANGLIVFYKVLNHNLGLAIIGFSFFLRFILSPLTRPYLESMKKMKELTPSLERLRKKYKDDKVKLAQAQAELYRQKGVSPGSGCLPYLIQIMVLIALFNVFTQTLSASADPTSKFNQLLYSPLKFSSSETLNTKFLYMDLTKPDIVKLSFIPFAIPGPTLILAAIVQFLLAKITTPQTDLQEKIARKTPQQSDDFQIAMQKSMIFTFPLLTLVVGMQFPSGLSLYWLVFSLSQAFQQVKTQGWGGLTPWIEKLKLLKS